jgi:ribosomal protein S18 acetylase RimI-like enzyme
VHEIIHPQARDLRTISSLLARAFVTDPVAQWLFPDSGRRVRDLEAFFLIQLRHGYLPRGCVVSTRDLSATAMWISSWTRPLGLIDRLAHLRLPLVLRAQYGPARELTRLLADAHPKAPHFYLGTIGTAPSAQSRGLASMLMDAFVADAQRHRVGAYLECSNEKNVSFYEHRGFRVLREIVAPQHGPNLWLMWRERDA